MSERRYEPTPEEYDQIIFRTLEGNDGLTFIALLNAISTSGDVPEAYLGCLDTAVSRRLQFLSHETRRRIVVTKEDTPRYQLPAAA